MPIDFEKYTPANLAEAAIVPQVLDNQWVPRTLISTMIRNKVGFSNKSVKTQREELIRKEWRRALIYGEQIIVNRAYMINNDIVVDDYDDKKNRIYFRKLIGDRVIIPFLFDEESPDQKPKFKFNEKRWITWLELLKDTYPACVRLNWDDQKLDFNRMSSAFHRYIKGLDTPGMPESLATYLSIPQEGIEEFKKRIFDVVDFATNTGRKSGFVTRNSLYEKFVTFPGTDVDKGIYGNGLFSAELKQIFDLKYNVNLPDALGRYALTPEDSLPRSALGDLDETHRNKVISEKNLTEIITILKQLSFEKISKGLYINSLANISLSDVLEARKMDEWESYTKSIHDLLSNPLQFEDRSNKVYVQFEALNRAISKNREEQLALKWDPWVKITLVLGLGAVELWINPADNSQKLMTKLGTDAVAAGFTPLLMRLTISAFNQDQNADLDVSLDFMRGTINNGQEAWGEIVNQLKPIYKELENSKAKTEDSNQSIPESQEI